MKYGLPYQGSKSAIAEWVVSILPASHTLVDLFAGGCAVTHCALLSGKWGSVVSNDLTDSPQVFLDAANGEYDGFATVPTREEFLASDDEALRLLYSFGNNKSQYLWGEDNERLKVSASRMLSAPSLHERRMEYRRFCRELLRFVKGDDPDGSLGGSEGRHGLQLLQGLQGLERMQLEGIERIERFGVPRVADRMSVTKADYRLVRVPDGATVYADPPYRDTEGYRGIDFDFDAFDAWLNGVDFPVFVSEYTAPAGCAEIASVERSSRMSQKVVVKRTERLFVQERYAEEYRQPEQTRMELEL